MFKIQEQKKFTSRMTRRIVLEERSTVLTVRNSFLTPKLNFLSLRVFLNYINVFSYIQKKKMLKLRYANTMFLKVLQKMRGSAYYFVSSLCRYIVPRVQDLQSFYQVYVCRSYVETCFSKSRSTCCSRITKFNGRYCLLSGGNSYFVFFFLRFDIILLTVYGVCTNKFVRFQQLPVPDVDDYFIFRVLTAYRLCSNFIRYE